METTVVKKSTKYNELPVKSEPASPAQLLELAISKDLDVSKLKELMQLQKEWQADQARKSFFAAMNLFQVTVPEIRKAKKVGFETQKGKTEYNYAPLADIVRQIKDTCRECGLSYRWEIQDSKDEIKITCLITHLDGHSEQTTMTVAPDLTGSKNPIQGRGSAIEYGKRYTLIGALGLSTTDSDVDGELPPVDMDLLHQQYMRHYNELVQIDSKFTKWHPDDWHQERNPKLYVKAIGEIRKKLAELKP
jgi:hypothetical protein